MKITEQHYDELLSFASKLIKKQALSFLTEYDLVHDAIAARSRDARAFIIKALFEEQRRQKALAIRVERGLDTVIRPGRTAPVQEKICGKCRSSLPHSFFETITDPTTGAMVLRSMCALCRKKENSAYYHRVKHSPRFKAYAMLFRPAEAKRGKKKYREKIKKKMLPGTRPCNKCGDDLDSRHYQLRHSRQRKTYYLSRTCLRCLNAASKIRYLAVGNDPEFKRRAKERYSAFWKKLKQNEAALTLFYYQRRQSAKKKKKLQHNGQRA